MTTRLRGNALSISTTTKQKLVNEFGDNIESKKENFIKYLQEKFYLTEETLDDTDFLDIPTPQFKGVNQEKSLKIKFSEDASLTNLGIEYETIKKQPNSCNFKYLLNNYDSSSISEFKIQDLLNYDFDEMSKVREKLSEVIDKLTSQISSNTLQHDEHIKKNEILTFLNMKMNEIKKSEKNGKIVINNIEKVKNITFSDDKLTVSFE
jgi:hypothetical protein